MKRIYYFVSIVFISLSCNKNSVEGDLSGKEYIRGRLFLTDTIAQRVTAVPQAAKLINISYGNVSDTLNYLTTVKTDDQGYFIFQNLKKDKPYRIYYEEKVNGIYYSAVARTNAPVDTLHLNASLALKKQNGLFYYVSDPSGGAIKGVKVCVFSNPTAYSSGNCDNANYPLTSDENGHAYKIDMSKGIYYIQCSVKINATDYIFKDTVKIEDTVVFRKRNLSEAQNTKNGITIFAVDQLGAPIGGATFCFFTSSILYKDTCDGSNFQVQADINGKAEKADLQQMKYYIYGHFEQGKQIFYSKETIDLKGTVIKDTMVFNLKY